MNDTFILEISQRIGWALVHSVWQLALIALVLAFGLRLLRGCSSHLRYSFMLFALCAMPFAATATFCVLDSDIASKQHIGESLRDSQTFGQTKHVRLGEMDLRAEADLRVDSPDGLIRSANTTANRRTWEEMLGVISATTQRIVERWMNTILAIWLFGMLVLSIRPLVSWRATRVLRSHGRSPVPESIASATVRIAKRFRIRQTIEVTQSLLVDVPTVIGWLKPLVLLPASAISGLTHEQLEAVIAHELAHVRRHDYLVNLFQLLMETVFFYHPAAWWVSRVIRVEREACCDDIAVHLTGDRAGYAKMLLWLEESRNSSALASLGMSSSGGTLLDRIRRIVSASPETNGTGPFTIAIVTMFIVTTGAFLAWSSGATLAQENAKSAVVPRDAATIRSWMKRAVEFEDWSRLAGLANRMAEVGEYEEAMEWLSKIPLGEYKDGKFPSEWYYKAITELCESALKHNRLDFVEMVLDQFLNPDKQSEISKKYPPLLFDVPIAVLEFHISKGDIDKALAYLNSRPVESHARIVHEATPRASRNGHTEHVAAFGRRLTDREVRFVCQRELAYSYYRRNAPDSVWQLADQMAVDHPNDLIEEVIVRDAAMRCYSKQVPDQFAELVPICRELISRLPNTKPSTTVKSDQQALSRDQMAQLEDTNRIRYMGNLALYAAYAKQYELAVELSANVPMLTTSGSWTMDLSDCDRHPVLYAVTELQKVHSFDEALALIARVKNESVALASLARLANHTGFSADRKHEVSYQRMVESLTTAYMAFAQQHDEATVLDIYEGLPESLHIHLQRVPILALQPDSVPYFDRERLLKRKEYFILLLEQGKVDEIVRHVEGLLKNGDLNGAKWIVKMLADAGKTEPFDQLCEQVKQAFGADAASDPKAEKALWEYRGFLAESAASAYFEGQRDLSYNTFMKLERIWMNPYLGAQVANKALADGDMDFLRRMEASPLPMLRAPALETLAVQQVLRGDINAARTTAETFEREFGEKEPTSIYRTITDDRVVKDPSRRLAATQLALQQLPFDSKDYAAIAVQRARLLGQAKPDQPLPTEWLVQLGQNPILKFEVEMAHANGCWEK